MKKCKYPMGACLNKQGMKEFGDVHPDGLIPVLNGISQIIDLGDVGEKACYLTNIPLLKKVDPEAYERLIIKLSAKFKISCKRLEKYINEIGLPLRAELVSSVEIDMRFVI